MAKSSNPQARRKADVSKGLGAKQRKQAVINALVEFTESLAALLLNEGVVCSEAERVFRAAYVRAVAKIVAPDGGRYVARVALLTGVDRHLIARLLKDAPPSEWADRHLRRNRLNRVLTGWRADPRFSRAGQPLDLLERGPRGSPTFWKLAKACAKDLYPGLILNELLQTKAIERLPNGRLRLCAHTYEGSHLRVAQVHEIAQRVRDFARELRK